MGQWTPNFTWAYLQALPGLLESLKSEDCILKKIGSNKQEAEHLNIKEHQVEQDQNLMSRKTQTIKLTEADIAVALILAGTLGGNITNVEVSIVTNRGFESGVYATTTTEDENIPANNVAV